jgi:hypothetical protein
MSLTSSPLRMLLKKAQPTRSHPMKVRPETEQIIDYYSLSLKMNLN